MSALAGQAEVGLAGQQGRFNAPEFGDVQGRADIFHQRARRIEIRLCQVAHDADRAIRTDDLIFQFVRDLPPQGLLEGGVQSPGILGMDAVTQHGRIIGRGVAGLQAIDAAFLGRPRGPPAGHIVFPGPQMRDALAFLQQQAHLVQFGVRLPLSRHIANDGDHAEDMPPGIVER